ncbi:transmembrane 6 superfamily member 2b [Ctenopharyngodon idella]|uniref:transmembrane 6 superfamily member 2b n=1 Tax=Ctenopharyngodon idella TaxID=7959 RepID=UPI00222F3F71|nr:transmembrane 6 superfamily member 2b [Ctenopharyngodon idella]
MAQEICVFLFSLTALGVLYTMNNVPAFQEPVVILEIGVAVLVAVFLMVYLATRYNPPKDYLFYVFAEFSFTCVIDLTSALEYDGFASGFMEFYQKTGEPYLGTPYAIMMCYWDGVVHFIIYLILVHRMSNRKQYRTLGLFWAGSLCANMIVFVPGIVVGKYGSEIRPAFWLNMPFLLVPIWGAVSLFSRPRDRPMPFVGASKVEREQKKALIWRPLDLLFVVYLVAAMGFTVFRGLAVLDCPLEILNRYVTEYEPYLKDPVGFPKVMMLLLLFHALPMLGSFAYGLCTPGCTWMLDWTVYFAGAILQCQWSHIGASLHPRTAEMYRIPTSVLVPILLLNLLYAVGPVLLALRCKREPDYFLSIAPVGQTNNEKKLR